MLLPPSITIKCCYRILQSNDTLLKAFLTYFVAMYFIEVKNDRNKKCTLFLSYLQPFLYFSAEPLWVILWTVQHLLCLFDYNGPTELEQNSCVLPTPVCIVFFFNFHACYVFKCIILYVWWFIYICIYLFIYYLCTQSLTQ